MNRLIISISLFLIPLISFGQDLEHDFQKLKLPRLNKSNYLTTFDSTQINYGIADKVTSKFGFSEYNKLGYSKHYKGIDGVPGVGFTTFSKFQYLSKLDSKLMIDENIISLQPDKKLFIYGFTTNINEGNRVNKNYSRLLMSAYRQEIDSDYLNYANNFTSLVVKDKSEFWKRNWINTGYGMSYLAKDNPFMGGKAFAVGFFYLWEALHYIPIFGGPFFGETQEDKIMIPIIGISSLIVWKGLFGGLIIGNRYLKINNNVHNSGYKIPCNLEY